MKNYQGYKIYMTVFGGNLSVTIDGEHNEKESLTRYAEICSQAIEREYPGATVEIETQNNVSGVPPQTQVVDPAGESGFPGTYGELAGIADHVERICDEVYGAMVWNVPTDSGTIAKKEDGHITPDDIRTKA